MKLTDIGIHAGNMKEYQDLCKFKSPEWFTDLQMQAAIKLQYEFMNMHEPLVDALPLVFPGGVREEN